MKNPSISRDRAPFNGAARGGCHSAVSAKKGEKHVSVQTLKLFVAAVVEKRKDFKASRSVD